MRHLPLEAVNRALRICTHASLGRSLIGTLQLCIILVSWLDHVWSYVILADVKASLAAQLCMQGSLAHMSAL